MNPRVAGERILTHNVLAQQLATHQVFNRIETRFLDRAARWRAFTDEIQRLRPSLVCLQESSIQPPDVLAEAMCTLGFAGVQQQRETPVPLAVFWRRANFDLLWSEERSRVQLCELQHRPTSKEIFVVNVHLQGRPDEVTSLTRVSQLHKALRHLELRLNGSNRQPQDARVFICGDFNSEAGDAPVRFIREGRLGANLEATKHQHVDEHGHPTEEITHPFRFVDVFEACGRVPEFTHVRNGVGSRVDFVFTQGVEVGGVLGVLPGGETWAARRVAGLPCENQCSDHLPLVLDFVL